MTTHTRTGRWLPRAAVRCLVLATVVHVPSCSGGQGGDSVQPAATEASAPASSDTAVTITPEEQRAGSIGVGPVEHASRASELTTTAVLQMNDSRTSRVGALVEGIVERTDAQVGDRVVRGARLASLHSHLVHEARAEHRQALAGERRAAHELGFAREAEARARRLLAAKAASLQEVQRAEADRVAAEEALVVASSDVRRAVEELSHIGIADAPGDGSRDVVPVLSPSGGSVIERLVTPGTAVTPGTPLYVVSDLSSLWAVAEIDEIRLPQLAVGRSASVTVSAYPDRAFAGTVVAIGDTINPETRRVTARIQVANPDGHLKPNMFATVRLTSGDSRNVALVPVQAIQKVSQQPVVFVERAPGQFLPRPVRTGVERDGRIEVLDGLSATDRIALTGAFLLKSKLVDAGSPE